MHRARCIEKQIFSAILLEGYDHHIMEQISLARCIAKRILHDYSRFSKCPFCHPFVHSL